MKFFLALFLLSFYTSGFSQTKSDLVQSIIKYNVLDSDCIEVTCSPSPQYNNFQKLKKIISEKELLQLSKHPHPVLRTYAELEMINQKKNISEILAYEIDKNETVETQDGCIGSVDPIESIIYHQYWNNVRLEAISKQDTDDKIRELKMKKALADDKMMYTLDSLVLHSEKDIYWLVYHHVFENRKFEEKDIHRIEELTFKNNNSYAFDYLLTNYPSKYQLTIKNYFTTHFLTAKFNSQNKGRYLFRFIEYLVETKDKEYRNIVIEKLKKDRSWKKYDFFLETYLEKNNINL
jgi:hypothetical protein